MEHRYAVLYQPPVASPAVIPAIVAVMRKFAVAEEGRIYFFRSTKSTNEVLADMKAALEPGASVIVIQADDAAYFGQAPFATAMSQLKAE
jgi:O-acetylhomoserine/O-acetylserine sulfhydrylase-like pyridoxal-dependent enzyme